VNFCHGDCGLTEDDYPDLSGGDLALIYPTLWTVLGEGIYRAKRRALGVMISQVWTPPLAPPKLYDNLL